MDQAPKSPLGLYEPLLKDPPTIRILTLEKGAASDSIRCRLDSTSLESALEYEALSYCWGNPLVTRPIQVNDRPLEVTCNLESALKHLRYDDRERMLWVDAISINQADVPERGHQVSIMGQIYQKAQRVIVWLGEESHVPRDAMRPFSFFPINERTKLMASEVRRQLAGIGTSDSSRLDRRRFNDDPGLPSAEDPALRDDTLLLAFTVLYMLSDDVHIESLVEAGNASQDRFRTSVLGTVLKIFQQPWWQRMWVVQEVVLAREVTVIYGHISAPWEMFARAGLGIERHRNSCCIESRTQVQEFADILTRISNEILEIEQSQLLRRGDDEVAKCFKNSGSKEAVAPRGGIIRQGRTKLCAYIWHTRHRNVLDPRDKIYGVLGLVPDWLDTKPIYPDYSISAYHVFKAAVLQLIQGQQNFDILSEVQGRWADDRDVRVFIESETSPVTAQLQKMVDHSRICGPYLPSWVPDFNAPAPYHQADRPAKLLLVNSFTVTDIPITVHDEFILSTMSLRIDAVLDMGPILFIPPGHVSSAESTLSETLSSQHVFKDWSSMAKTFKYFMRDEYPLGGGTFDRAFMRTISNNVKWSRHPYGNRRPILILEMGMGDGFYNELEEGDFWAFEKWLAWALDRETLSLREFCGSGGVFRSLNKAVISACVGRRFFVTTNGFMGIGPPGMRRSDLVHVFAGSRAPFILRRGEEAMLSDKGLQRCHTLIGDCYLQGLMRGEIMKEYERIEKAKKAGQTDFGTTFMRQFEWGTVFLN